MGSGLILLVIVGAWLAVLVPMGLRAHDGAAASRSAERWSDAMRVLSRRTEAAPLADEPDDEHDEGEQHQQPAPRRAPLVALRTWRPAHLLDGLRAAREDRHAGRAPLTPAARRRRVLLALVLVAVLTAVAGQVGPAWLLDVTGLAVVLALAFLVSCRRQAVRRADRAARRERAEADRRAAARRREADIEYVRVLPAPAPAAPVAEPEPVHVPEQARPAAEWQPVPVPLPTYVGKAVAPRRSAVVLEPERWAPEQADDEVGGSFEPRRVVGGW